MTYISEKSNTVVHLWLDWGSGGVENGNKLATAVERTKQVLIENLSALVADHFDW